MMPSPTAFAGHPHPLEIIPFFRRIPSSSVRNFAYTFIWNCALGALFYASNLGFTGKLPPFSVLLVYLVMANLIGYAIHALFWMAQRSGLAGWVDRQGLVLRAVYFAGLPTIGVIAGFQLWLTLFHLEAAPDPQHGMLVLRSTPEARQFFDPSWTTSMAVTTMLISLGIAAVFSWRERRARAEMEEARERARVERIEREAAAAELRALQAQIEPHFLFNTLANVASLVDSQPAQAKHMLERFNRFLRASLAATREPRTTLGAEGDLVAAYLDVLRVRMHDRLRYRIDIASELASFALPPMLIQPLVENAIRHGLEPKVEGGEVVVSARREGDHVAIEVRDSGIGFAPTTRGGTGLTNLRGRLGLLYGALASLSIGEGEDGGTCVVMRIPG
jgi:signal transduction histidine kinase